MDFAFLGGELFRPPAAPSPRTQGKYKARGRQRPQEAGLTVASLPGLGNSTQDLKEACDSVNLQTSDCPSRLPTEMLETRRGRVSRLPCAESLPASERSPASASFPPPRFPSSLPKRPGRRGGGGRAAAGGPFCL